MERQPISKKYKEWREKVILLDNQRLRDRDRIRRLVAATSPTTSRSLSTPSTYARTTSTKTHSVPTSRTRPLPLTDVEKDLLSKNNGCFKCRMLFVDHTSRNCPNGWPDANIEPITPASVEAACGCKATPSKPWRPSTTKTSVAAVYANDSV